KGIAAFAKANLIGRFDAAQKARLERDMKSGGRDPEGALNHSLLYLACGHDSSSGRLSLSPVMGQVLVDWPAVDKERFIDVITREMQEHAKLHGAHFVPNPRSTMMGGGRIMTTHPLGGVPMGDDADKGAVE